MRCVVALLPANGGNADRARQSIDAARDVGLGDIGDLVVQTMLAGMTPQEAMSEAAAVAKTLRADWLLAITAAETVVPDIFVKTAPALRLHDAVWGAAGLLSTGRLERITRLAAQDMPSFFHATLAWWIGPSHLVRPDAALAALPPSAHAGWYATYMQRLWRQASSYKTAQCLTFFPSTVPELPDADRRHLIDALERDPVFMTVHADGRSLRLPYTGLNPVIEREQMRGLFFEHEELAFLADRLPRGLRIVDAGANTGNHTLFFASVMAAEIVIPIEPDPRAVKAIRDVIAANALSNIDTSCLGYAVGAEEGRLRPVHSTTAGLGATHYVPDPAGSVGVAPLDKLISGPVDFLKIDVEGMEMEVLSGAGSTIQVHRPTLFIEVLDTSIARFMAWIDNSSYVVEKLFPDKTHCNYLAVPVERSRGRAGR